MFKNPYTFLVLLNFLLLSLLYGDLMSSSLSVSDEFGQFYALKEGYGHSGIGVRRYELHNYLECKSGTIYPIGIVPDFEIQTGSIIVLYKTPYLNKVKSVQFTENGNSTEKNLSFLLDGYVLIFAVLTLMLTVAYLFKQHPLLEYVLSIFSVLTYAIAFVYLHYL